jgi:phosphoglycolate phosphatase
MNQVLLLFDIDGTLLRSGGASVRAMKTVAQRMFGESFTWDGVVFPGNIDPLIYQQAAQLNGLADPRKHEQRFHDSYIEELEAELRRSASVVRAPPGVHDTVNRYRVRAAKKGDVELGLLTGNYTRAVPIKLLAIGLQPEWFPVTAFGDDAPSRPDLALLALKKMAAKTGKPFEPRRAVVIGDTPRDVHCGKAHGCSAVGVATGGHSVDELRQSGADLVLEDLSDPQPLDDFVEALLT